MRQQSLMVAILTNATLIDAELAQAIVDSGVHTVGVSIDGPKDVHDSIRGHIGAFDDLMRGLKHLLDVKHARGVASPTIGFNCTLSSLNYQVIDQLPLLAAELGIGYGISALQFFSTANDPSVPYQQAMGENRNPPELLRMIDAASMRHSLTRLRANSIRVNLPVRMFPNFASGDEIVRWYTDRNFSYTCRCLAPWDFLKIDPFGRMSICIIGECLGNLLSQTVEEVWNCDRFREFRRSLRSAGLFPACTHCCLLNNRAWGTLYYERPTS
jgi:MoaA/NifB/PqqE/SkfB family radical SAM enzyme